MKKKIGAVAVAMVLGMAVAACGQSEDISGAEQTGSVEMTETGEGAETGDTADEQDGMNAQTEVQDGAGTEAHTEVQSEAETDTQTETQDAAAAEPQEEAAGTAGEASVTGGYEDNFAVDESAVVEFGTKIKDAVAAKDLEALADLTSFPVYVGFTDQSETPETREAFTALGADRIFTQELMDSVAGAELTGQQPSMAGFVVATGDGPNIIFGVVNGELAITGFNY